MELKMVSSVHVGARGLHTFVCENTLCSFSREEMMTVATEILGRVYFLFLLLKRIDQRQDSFLKTNWFVDFQVGSLRFQTGKKEFLAAVAASIKISARLQAAAVGVI